VSFRRFRSLGPRSRSLLEARVVLRDHL
jgi:hypothetical protein